LPPVQAIFGRPANFAQRGGEPLESTGTATTVRVKQGKTVRTDGPFAETREQLGGFYVIEAKDLDEAVGIAARIPASKNRKH
jgi:hypothetical protein